MIPIKIKYINTTLNLFHPDKLNELDAQQLFDVIELYILNTVPIEQRLDDRIHLMQSMLKKNLSKYVKTKWYKLLNKMIETGMIADFFKLQEFITADQTFNNWIIKFLWQTRPLLHGPRDRFSYMKFGEFIVADMLFMAYFENKDENILDQFIAVLFREANTKAIGNEDLRVEFNTNTIPLRVALIKPLNNIIKQSIVFNYAGVRHWLGEKYPHVFNPPEKKQNELSLSSNEQGGWMNIRRHLAGGILNLEKVDNVLLHDVLSDLNDKMSKE
jgi:hypothetical protein